VSGLALFETLLGSREVFGAAVEAIIGSKEDEFTPANPRSRYGILSAEILPASELPPLIDTMTLDEQIRVVGKLRAFGSRIVGANNA
jgi:hypothetical protein